MGSWIITLDADLYSRFVRAKATEEMLLGGSMFSNAGHPISGSSSPFLTSQQSTVTLSRNQPHTQPHTQPQSQTTAETNTLASSSMNLSLSDTDFLHRLLDLHTLAMTEFQIMASQGPVESNMPQYPSTTDSPQHPSTTSSPAIMQQSLQKRQFSSVNPSSPQSLTESQSLSQFLSQTQIPTQMRSNSHTQSSSSPSNPSSTMYFYNSSQSQSQSQPISKSEAQSQMKPQAIIQRHHTQQPILSESKSHPQSQRQIKQQSPLQPNPHLQPNLQTQIHGHRLPQSANVPHGHISSNTYLYSYVFAHPQSYSNVPSQISPSISLHSRWPSTSIPPNTTQGHTHPSPNMPDALPKTSQQQSTFGPLVQHFRVAQPFRFAPSWTPKHSPTAALPTAIPKRARMQNTHDTGSVSDYFAPTE
eukprot:TRINITY_DN3129_c0_g1_i1.p1 TRINITY_DN3129_c0_g1~~TRINITY_DN3129_c0_g1_i1.p1  ORF type:complete len:416 (+),score=96.73 TRINITY_DN3129_c0_g1_i1:124-1371(+)